MSDGPVSPALQRKWQSALRSLEAQRAADDAVVRDGEAARAAGTPLASNPFPLDALGYDLWRRGWTRAAIAVQSKRGGRT